MFNKYPNQSPEPAHAIVGTNVLRGTHACRLFTLELHFRAEIAAAVAVASTHFQYFLRSVVHF